MSTIGELERAAGITNREAFWERFAGIAGAVDRGGKLRSNGLEAGLAELRRLIAVKTPSA